MNSTAYRSKGMLVALVAAGLAICWATSAARADVFTNVPEASDYTLVYTLPIPNTGNFRDATPVPYSVNNSASIGLYDRIAYYLELDSGSGPEYVYASMDSFNKHASKIGVPHNIFNPVKHQQIVNNMNVFSNKGGIVTGTGIATGNIEMWPSNYGPANDISIPGASSSLWDFGDGGSSTGAGYGSFQVHNHGANQTLLAYNRWGTTGTSDLGIGNRPTGHPDWTFAQNADTYSTAKELQILVREVEPPPLPPLPPAPPQIIANVPEAKYYGLVYLLPINNTTFNPGQYVVDNSASVPDGSFKRIAYYVELESTTYGSQFAWVSMDAFNIDASLIGVPNTDAAIQQMIVNNMNVVSNVPGVVNGTGIATGNIEFWNKNYGGGQTGLIPGGAGVYDYDDSRSTGGTYGSMQIHNFGAQQTIFAYNEWNNPNNSCLGIGNQPTGNPDWTFARNANIYTVKNLYVLVGLVPEPSTFLIWSLLAGLGITLAWRRRRDSRD